MDDLTAERFSRSSTALWWPTPRAHTNDGAMQYLRLLEQEDRDLQEQRLLELGEAVDDDDEEVADGS